MKMKPLKSNKKILGYSSITLILMLVVIACTTQTNKKTTEVDVRVGFNGLLIDFLKNTPPQKVFEGDMFPVMIKVKNSGAYSMKGDKKAVISLGVEKDYIGKLNLLGNEKIQKIDNAASFNLEGRSIANPRGEEKVISYNLEAGKIDPQSEAHPSTITATLCYPYETVLDATICIDTDVNNLRPSKKVCNAQDLILNNGQGAPVAITKVEISMLPAQISEKRSEKIKPQFLIYVENKGNGLVIKNEAVDDFCTKSDTSHENFNIVYVDVSLSNKPLECQIDKKERELGHIKLKDKKDIIRCSLDEGIDRNQDPYFSPFKVVLNYGYTHSISSNYLIQKLVSWTLQEKFSMQVHWANSSLTFHPLKIFLIAVKKDIKVST